MDKHFMERIAMATDLGDEPIPGLPLVEIAGDRRVLIEHHCGVTQYGRCRISVKVKYGSVVIIGTQLELTRMTGHQLIVTGRIECVQLERSGR
ncbi:MAG: YabP/YqfC family sporulation protein [Oscillospiraceae bacterium]|nr:YabP/YqfC family sporulation protein [Oscillospiraceae bacterium]